MLFKKRGALPAEQIIALHKQSFIKCKQPFTDNQIQPASMDLRLSKKCWEVEASFLTGQKISVRQKLSKLKTREIDIGAFKTLRKGKIYIIQIQEELNLPRNISAAANAKSSTGRLDILTRLISDNSSCFDLIKKGYKGKIYVEVAPISFSISIKEGITLNQIRFHNEQNIMTDRQLEKLNAKFNIVENTTQIDNGVTISVNLKSKANEPIGFKARENCPAINLSKLNFYKVETFWERLFSKKGYITLAPGAFYILRSKEYITIPPQTAAEMVPYEVKMGEFRVHYAGFFDPGFGFAKNKKDKQSKAVLEIRCHETPFMLQDSQIIGKLIYETLTSTPNATYGEVIGSNYQGQTLKLSKHFESWQ
ncbi:MAG: 2'-deoxycytidine 5'-triphosphate deaminase [Paracoccaceae bacterium]